jgi:hypothetical protein
MRLLTAASPMLPPAYDASVASEAVAAEGGIEPKAEVTTCDAGTGPHAVMVGEKRGTVAPPNWLAWWLPPPIGSFPSKASTSANSERAAGDHTAMTSADSSEAANWAAKCGLTGDEERCSNGWSMRNELDELVVDALDASSGEEEASACELLLIGSKLPTVSESV